MVVARFQPREFFPISCRWKQDNPEIEYMCGRFMLVSKVEDLQTRFGFQTGPMDLGPRYNVAPTQSVLAVVNDGHNHAEMMRWGLIPYWAKDPAVGNRMINARAETLAERPAFRRALERRRCLIPADGFYEWRRDGTKRVPIYVSFKSREPFGMAGLWEVWKAPTGEWVHSCTIVTTTPNALLEPIHDRMPVILPREAEEHWLERTNRDPSTLVGLLAPYPSDEMEAYAVSSRVNSPKYDDPACLTPA